VPHYISTHSSRLNLVERWFAEITNKSIRRGVFGSVGELTDAIRDYIKAWNESGRSFSWTKSADDILAKVRRAKSTTTAKGGGLRKPP